VASKSEWETTFSMTLVKQPTVLAVACQDLLSVGGIHVSGSNGLRTDGSWRCSNTYRAGWNLAGFDESGWTPAYEIGANGMEPWSTRFPNIAADAKWIWTAKDTWYGRDIMVYCRKTLKPILPECSWKNQTGEALLKLARSADMIGQLSTGKKCRVTGSCKLCNCPYYVQYSNDNGATWLGYTDQGTPGGTGCVYSLVQAQVSCKIKSVRAFVAAQKQIPMYAWFGHHIWRMGWSWSRSQNTTMSHGRSKYRFLLMETTKQ